MSHYSASILDAIASRIEQVSPSWQPFVQTMDTARDDEPRPDHTRMVAVESIYEGWLTHRNASRILSGASPDLSLLIGDWCYASGLCDITDHGTLEEVSLLAELVAEVSANAMETTDSLMQIWNKTIAELQNV